MEDYIFYPKNKFYLSEKFLEQYKGKQPNWSNPLAYVTYKRTYARAIEGENRTEEWWETCKRVVEGTFTAQMHHCKTLHLPWKQYKAQKSAQEMFQLMWKFFFLPPGRGLWAMGTNVVWSRGGAALNNCGFISTKEIDYDFSSCFVWLMDMSMVGVGCSTDLRGTGKVNIVSPKYSDATFIVPDSKEGWCEVVRIVLDSYVGKSSIPNFDYSEIRPEGSPIKTFGGIAPGPKPLKLCVEELKSILDKNINSPIKSVTIVDLMNSIGKCVVSGGVRRTAELILGESSDEEYVDMKNPDKYSDELKKWRWASNNSILAYQGMDYSPFIENILKNGEPGFVYLDNIRKYGRLKDGMDYTDELVEGVNPCGEQQLCSYELCTLCEVFPSKHDNLEEFLETIRFAYLYGKTVTLIPTNSERTNQVLLRNRRIGLSLSGIVDAIQKLGRREFLRWCDKGYERIKELDKKYSSWLCVPTSIRTTTVKPSGTISLLTGVSPGIHYPHSEYYIRRIRIQTTSPLIEKLQEAGIPNEKTKYNDNTVVFEFPMKTENFSKCKKDVTIWEQLENAASLQNYWSNNCISQTVTVKKNEFNQLKTALEVFEDRLKTVSFLPLEDHHYEQAPYEEITKEEYEKRISEIKPFNLTDVKAYRDEVAQEDLKYCNGVSCELKLEKQIIEENNTNDKM